MSLFNTFASCQSEKIWAFFGAQEILKLSVCSRGSAGMFISAPAIKTILKEKSELNFLGRFELHFSSDLTIGMLRRICNRLRTGTSAMISIDDLTGRVMLDVGSAFNDKDAYLATEVSTVPVTAEEEPVFSEEVFKHLNLVSFDEYDDFNPRHPKPREAGSHRRGDSYFSSDITEVANEPKLRFDIQTMNATAELGPTAAAGEDDASQGNLALKNKFMNKSKNIPKSLHFQALHNQEGAPPRHNRGAARRQLQEDDEEDN